MKTFLITDTHFNHAKVIEYCDRPLDFEERILKNCLDMIKEDDTLIHLGDICIGNDKESHAKYIEPIKGTKILVRGNHDKRSDNWYLNHGWDFVCDSFTGTYFGKKVLFSHTPQIDKGDFDLNIHGHLHNKLYRIQYDGGEMNMEFARRLTDKHKLLSIEYADYKPFLLTDQFNLPVKK